MGYRIPGPDYIESDKLDINVGDQLGTIFASAIGKFSNALQKSQAEASKTTQLKEQYSSTVLIENNKVINSATQAGKATLGEKNPILNAWSGYIQELGQAATKAQVEIQFGNENGALSDKEKAERLDIVNKFTNYTSDSEKNMGMFIADVNARNVKGNVTVGDTTNGESIRNSISLDAHSGQSAEDLYGDGATIERGLGEDKVSLYSKVRIPFDSNFMKTFNSKTDGTAAEVLGIGAENEKSGIDIIDVDGKKYYQFEQSINTAGYGGESNSDFVIPESVKMDAGRVFEDNGVIKNGNITPGYFATQNDGGTKDDKKDDTAIAAYVNVGPSDRPGFTKTSKMEIFDMSKIASEQSYQDEITAEVKGILLPSRSTNSKLENISAYGVVSLNAPAFSDLKEKYKTLRGFVEGGTDKEKNAFANAMVSQSNFNDMFKSLKNPSSAIQYTQVTADKKLVEYLNDNNISNQANQPYSIGDPVYVKETTSNDKTIVPGVGNIYDKVSKQYADNPTAENEKAIFSTPIKISGGKENTFHLWLEPENGIPGTYVVDADGVKVGTQNEPLKQGAITSALGRGKSKK